MSALPAIDSLLKEKGLLGYAATHSSTAPVFDWYAKRDYGLNKDAIEFNRSAFEFVKKKKIPNVVLCARWKSYVSNNSEGTPKFFYEALIKTVKQFSDIGCQPWILLDVPEQPFNVPMALANSSLSLNYLVSVCSSSMKENSMPDIDEDTIKSIKEAGGRIIDPKPAFLDSSKSFYMFKIDDDVIYRDEQHLTVKGANLVLLPFLRNELFMKLIANNSDTKGDAVLPGRL